MGKKMGLGLSIALVVIGIAVVCLMMKIHDMHMN